MKKYFNMEFGTYKINDNKITLDIEKSLLYKINNTKHISLDEIDDIAYADERFLPVYIDETEDKFLLNFDLNPQFKNLKVITNEKLPIKLAVAKNIVKQDILATGGFQYVSLNPSSIWYLPMRTIKYTYRTNTHLPQDNQIDNFAKYKAIVMFILTGATYEKLLVNSKILNGLKQKNPYLEQIAEAQTLDKLLFALESIEDSISHNEWANISKKENNFKKIIYGLLAFALISNLGTAVIVTKSQQALQKEKIAQIVDEKANNKLNDQIEEAFKRKDYQTATTLMIQNKISHKEIGNSLFKYKQYKKALAYNPNLLEKIIKVYWSADQKEKVLDLKLPKEASKKLKDKLTLEQAIVAFNTETINENIAFTDDRDTMLRMGEIFLANKDFLNTQVIYEKLESLGYKNESQYLRSVLDKNQAEEDIKNIQTDIEKMNSSDDSNKEVRLKELNTKLENAQETLKQAEKEIKKTEGKLDNDSR